MPAALDAVGLSRQCHHMVNRGINVEGSEWAEGYERRCFVLDGENSSVAVRRLDLT